MKPRICVIGSANTDMIIKVPHLPVPGETILGGEFSMAQGGKGANQAVAAARAGADVIFVSCVGNDLFGKNTINELTKEGINISHVKVQDKISSGIALINVADSGENSISVASGANSHLLPDDIVAIEDSIKSCQIVLVQLEIRIDTVNTIIHLAKKNRVPVILNPAPAQKLDPEVLKDVDIITPNETESALITGMGSVNDPVKLSRRLKKMGPSTVVITLGSKGAFYSSNDTEMFIEGHEVKPVDTTGAGDVFNGYLAVALALGRSIEESIQIANKAASISVTRLGAQPSIPFIQELEILV